MYTPCSNLRWAGPHPLATYEARGFCLSFALKEWIAGPFTRYSSEVRING